MRVVKIHTNYEYRDHFSTLLSLGFMPSLIPLLCQHALQNEATLICKCLCHTCDMDATNCGHDSLINEATTPLTVCTIPCIHCRCVNLKFLEIFSATHMYQV
jgi:hypothetical protein